MLAECSAGSPPLSDQVLNLSPFITSVYDLRLLLTLNSMVDPPNEGKQVDQRTTKLLNTVFGHILSQKLVLDDDTCVYFRLVLQYCAGSQLLSPSQFMKWKVQATKVNVESAEWVVELKKHVNENSHRLQVQEQAIGAVVQGIHGVHLEVKEIRCAIFDINDRVKHLQSQVETGEKVLKSLVGFTNQLAGSVNKRLTQCESNIQSVASHLQTFQNSYMQRLEQEERLRYIKATCGLLAPVVGFVFAPMLKTAFDSLIDLANPIEIFNHAYQETDIVDFLADKGYEELLKPEVQRQLEKHAIPTIEFESLLRQGIMVTKPELADECERRGMTLAAVDMDYANEVPALLKYESKLAETMKELDLVSASLKADTRRSSIKTDFNGPVLTGQMNNSSNFVDPKEWTVKRSSTAAPSKSTDEDAGATPQAPEETGRQLDNNGRTDTLNDGEVVTFVEDLEALPYHLAVMASHGDLSEFQDLSDVIDDDVDCVNVVTEVRRIKQQTQNVTINAAEYAQLLGYSELAGFISSQMGTSSPLQPRASVTFLDDIDACPFLLAVRESEGDVSEFKQWLEMLEWEDGEIGTKVRATISREEVDVKKWSPVELACHLGYVDIVKHLLLKKRAKSSERNIVVMIRAKDRAKTLAA
ncbi:hypothetical protein V7S43_011830 [Phytophthora oleae]|uniref:Ankyrin repeat protein n=1 Tax=Phytophthora oleae TaxID=2107226 RepID=A0ABD3FBW7_9STRA